MSAVRQSHRARLVRAVSVDVDGTVTVTDGELTPWYGIQLSPTARRRRTRDSAAPRTQDSLVLRYLPPPLGPSVSLTAGSRVEMDGTIYELLSDPRDVKPGLKPVAYEAPVLPVTTLYPLEAALHEMGSGGALVTAAVFFAMYSSDESGNDTGIYEDFEAETSLEHRDTIRVNRELRLDGRVYKIVNASLDTVGAFVKFRVRKTGAQG